MANKASKSLARTNAATLNRTHLITLSLHAFFILYRLFFRRASLTKYVLLSAPALIIEFYLERLGRPKLIAETGELRSPGEDLAAGGVTEYLWDVVYVTWICLGLVGVAGEWAWWVALVVPAYGAFLAWTLYSDFKGGKVPGMPDMGGGKAGEVGEAGQSKRQKKMEQRGGQKVRYR